MQRIVEVQGLTKSYGPVKAVRGTEFYVEKGTLFALLGENGAGKSTTIDMLTTLIQPDAGVVTVAGARLGTENDTIRTKIGIVFQDSLLDKDLTVRENLLARGALYGLSKKALTTKAEALAKTLEMEDFLDRRYGKLSGGQRRRADIARALLHTPELLILDEPTTGLDPASRKAIWETVRRLQRENGTTVLLTTHYMEEAAAADYVVIMGRGRVLAKGTAPVLKSEYAHDLLALTASDPAAARAALDALNATYTEQNGRFTVRLESTLAALPLLQKLAPYTASFEVVQGSLEDAFLRIIKQDKAEEAA